MEIITTKEKIEKLKSRDPVELRCISCGNIFSQPKHRFLYLLKKGKSNGCFCSRKCLGDYKNTKTKVTCTYCNSILYRTKKEIENSKTLFCSSSCSAKYWNSLRPKRQKTKIQKISKRKKHSYVELICSNCSVKFVKYSSKINEKSKFHFCNKSCQAIYANKTWNRKSRFGINKSRCETIMKNIILKEFPKIEILENNRTVIPGSLEIDLYIPDKKIGIELNGPCHYIPIFGNDELYKTKDRDLRKLIFCQENGIKLFIINVMGLRNQEKTLQEVFDAQIKSHLL